MNVPKQDDQPTPTDRDFECPYIQRCSFPLCIDTASHEFDNQCVNSRIRAKLAQPEEPQCLWEDADSNHICFQAKGHSGPHFPTPERVEQPASEGGGAGERDIRQKQVHEWAVACFGLGEASSLPQRGIRLLEEAAEAAQATGVTLDKAKELMAYVWARPAGNISQELGGVGVTTLALAEAAGVSAESSEITEVQRILSKPREHFAQRNTAKNEAGFKVAAPTPPATGEAAKCGELVIHLIAGASWVACGLPKGHAGGHRGSGTCFKHGQYLGEEGAVPQCPEWPICVEMPTPDPAPVGDVEQAELPPITLLNLSEQDHIEAEHLCNADNVFAPNRAGPWEQVAYYRRKLRAERAAHKATRTYLEDSQRKVAELTRISGEMLLSSSKMAFDAIPKLEAENQELRRKVEELTITPEQLSEKLTHGRNCRAWTNSAGHEISEEDCTCGLRFRVAVQNEQNLRAAWMKRANEAEAELAAMHAGLQEGLRSNRLLTAKEGQ